MNINADKGLFSEELALLAEQGGTQTGLSEDRAGRAMLEKISGLYQSLSAEMRKVIVGQEEVLDLILIAMISKGHVLLEGVPGLGKTLMFKTLSNLLQLSFSHVQFTPDLMPSDILGTEVLETDPETGARGLKFLQGPVFCHFLLADEINRTSPKTQAALLQAMQEQEVSIGTKTYRLEPPFFVLATQNPMDQEGVYPLPEAQLDRFMFNIFIDYPSYDEEVEIARRYTRAAPAKLSAVMSRSDMLGLQEMVRAMLISDSVLRYAVDLAVASRPRGKNSYDFVNQYVSTGAGPRATLNLILAAKARALLKGRFCALSEDVRAVAASVLRHRLKVNFTARAENISALELVRKLVESGPDPRQRG